MYPDVNKLMSDIPKYVEMMILYLQRTELSNYGNYGITELFAA